VVESSNNRIPTALPCRDNPAISPTSAILKATPADNPSEGYNDLRAELSYRWKPRRLTVDNLSEIVVGVVGSNLLNDDIRNHVSYNKDEVLMPGRSGRFFANLKY
jgi:iron complex outermembrane receptor protein